MAKTLDKPSLYDTDYVAWLDEQVSHLRATRLSALDVENVADELESLMRSQRQQLENRLEVLPHLLKWDHQPAKRTNCWRATVEEQRSRIRRLLRDSASLKRQVEPICLDVYADAIRAAAIETRLSETAFPPTLRYSVEEIFERDSAGQRASRPTHRPERNPHDRAPDPHRPPECQRQRRRRARRSPARHRAGPARMLASTCASPRATRSRPGRSPRASRSASSTRSSASRPQDIAPGRARPCAQLRACATSRATTPFGAGRAADRFRAGGRARDLPRLRRAATARSARATIIGILSTVNCSATVSQATSPSASRPRSAGAVPECRRRRGAHPRHRLRHGRSRRGLRHPAAHAVGLRARTRTSPAILMIGLGCEVNADRLPAGGLRHPARAALPHHDACRTTAARGTTIEHAHRA